MNRHSVDGIWQIWKFSTLLLLLTGCQADIDLTSSRLPAMTAQSALSTQLIHDDSRQFLPFGDSTDFDNAQRGFLTTIEDMVIRDEKGKIIRDLRDYDFLQKEAPQTVHPSLWRQSQLNRIHGLFMITQGIYQIRGFDLANMTLIEGEEGWIVVDPLTSQEAARAGLDLANSYLGQRPVKAIIITHSHIDHFGGIHGVLDDEQFNSGELEVVAPEGFFHYATSENILAGNAMVRRSTYMYGLLLTKGPEGMVGNGLGQEVTIGSNGIFPPTKTITQTGDKFTLDGVEFIFQNTPGAEAPAELMFYMPQYRAFCQAEEINHTLHNLYTLRGAQVRNGLKWAQYIDETIRLYGDSVDISFGSHHWPTWGQENILEFWKSQRDTYKYIHDETLHLANKGFTMNEIADMITLPETLAKNFANRDYYGTISHNAKAQYQLYYGWFDGNPANLNPLPPRESSEKYVSYMGGRDTILNRALEDFNSGQYRWVATVLNHVVFADPSFQPARDLLAKAYRQMAWQSESGPWRNFYLTAAKELEEGLNREALKAISVGQSPQMLINIPLPVFYDFLAIKLDRSKAKGRTYRFNMIFPDIDTRLALLLENQVLHNRPDWLFDNPDATITMNKSTFDEIITGQSTGMNKFLSGEVKIKGNRQKYTDFQELVKEPFNLLFNIIEP